MNRRAKIDYQDLKDRRGRVEVTEALLESAPEALLELFTHVVVLRAYGDAARAVIVYEGLSLLFDPIPAEEAPPLYQLEVTGFHSGQILFTAVRAGGL